MTCAELESRLCDYVDGTLAPAEKAVVESHLSACPQCAELVRDAAAAVAFMDRAAETEPPRELMTRLLFEPPWAREKPAGSGMKRWFHRLVEPIRQPRFAMGMAMTIIFFAMLARFVAPVRQLRAEDLQPSRIWAALDDRIYRGWQRSVKFYENIRFVYQIQNRLREWQQEQDEEQRQNAGQERQEPKNDERRLPLGSSAPAPGPSEKGR